MPYKKFPDGVYKCWFTKQDLDPGDPRYDIKLLYRFGFKFDKQNKIISKEMGERELELIQRQFPWLM